MMKDEVVFSCDWFSVHIPIWTKHFSHLSQYPNARFLEIGSWEGRSAHWIATNLLGPGATLDCVDTWEGSIEHDSGSSARIWNMFQKNLKPFLHDGRVKTYRGKSTSILPLLFSYPAYDFVYVDGSHMAGDVLLDACLAFLLVKPGGFIVFDDYRWTEFKDPRKCPAIAIDSFLRCFDGQYEVVFSEYQVAIRKTAPTDELIHAL